MNSRCLMPGRRSAKCTRRPKMRTARLLQPLMARGLRAVPRTFNGGSNERITYTSRTCRRNRNCFPRLAFRRWLGSGAYRLPGLEDAVAPANAAKAKIILRPLPNHRGEGRCFGIPSTGPGELTRLRASRLCRMVGCRVHGAIRSRSNLGRRVAPSPGGVGGGRAHGRHRMPCKAAAPAVVVDHGNSPVPRDKLAMGATAHGRCAVARSGVFCRRGARAVPRVLLDHL